MRRHPTIDPPHIPLPEAYRSELPSPIRSPRHSRNFSKAYDPFLRDLSPTTTLRAFTAASSSSAGNSSDELIRSIESASPSERAFGARIAQTCRDIRSWENEVQSWQWPGTFEAPPKAEWQSRAKRMLDDLHQASKQLAQISKQNDDSESMDFWGSLPYAMIVMCEERVEDIRDALEELDVEELKNHVLNVHTIPKSPQPNYALANHQDHSDAQGIHRLDDFTALITATILQALPSLSRLHKLLNGWSVRLTVLRKVPGFLQELREVRSAIEASWSAMLKDIEGDAPDSLQIRDNYEKLHSNLGKRVVKLGRRLDSVLDELEGREDTLPEHWIDAFEALETSYGDWVQQTEQELMTRELGLNTKNVETTSQKDEASTVSARTHDEDSALQIRMHDTNGTAAVGLGVDLNLREDGFATGDTQSTLLPAQSSDAVLSNDQPVSPAEQAESPVLGSSTMASFADANAESSTESDREEPARPGSDHSRYLARRSVPPLPEVDLSRSSSVRVTENPSPRRPRHIPIAIGYNEKEAVMQPQPLSQITRERSASSIVPSSSATFPSDMPQRASSNNVRARAAFLNGGIEQTQTLQKSVNSPVRPFEHASQAFTKLFAKANAAQHSRSSSSSSSKSSGLRKGLGFGGRKEPGRLIDRSNTSFSSLRSAADAPRASELGASPASETASPAVQNPRPRASTSVAELPAQSFVTPETQFGFEPSTGDSRTTIESSWDSPALSDVHPNWPFRPQHRLNVDETASPEKPLDAGFFEKMFVDSLPSSPNLGVVDKNPLEWTSDYHQRPATSPGVSENAKAEHQRSSSARVLPPPTMKFHHRLGPFSKRDNFTLDGSASEITTPGSIRSNVSTPEVQNASAASYFQPKEVTTPPPFTRGPAGSSTKKNGEDGSQHPSKNMFLAELPAEPVRKSPSEASTNNSSNSDLKTVEIPGSSSQRSFSSNDSPISHTRSVSSPGSFRSRTRTSPKGSLLNPSPEKSRPRQTRAPYYDQSRKSSNPPLNLTMHKRRNVADPAVGTSPTSRTSSPTPQVSPVKRPHHKKSPSNTEQFDRHVSRVLSTLPNRIRFTPLGEIDGRATPEPRKASGGRRSSRPPLLAKTSRPSLTLSPAKPDLTKTHRPKASFSSGDSEVKLYHLSQEGERQPIKLYVRLVGEGERVMVRVGGGWADLGEYLRNYAEHHGHRTVSDGRLELASMPGSSEKNNKGSVGASGSKIKTPMSRPGSVLDQRPTSRLSTRRRSSLAMYQQHSAFGSRPGSPAMVFAMDNTPTRPSTATTTGSSSNGGGGASGAVGTPLSLTISTSHTGSSKPNSRPSTADDGTTTVSSSPSAAGGNRRDTTTAPPSSSWTAGSSSDLGLAGPATSRKNRPRGELDEHKARWVEDMIDRAKAASVEKKRSHQRLLNNSYEGGTGGSNVNSSGGVGGNNANIGNGGGWGDMGKIGGTRRVIFRSPGRGRRDS
ncbi:hypothetical protein AAFC00_002050 [Neodothiora populina]|uniref:GAR domain-containing protein n=1 Tax=Neodothiora populina TaxID=2781224 RepID=A0ABR3PGE6_9PEZI